jgi:exopolysaccharide production protein ExoY
MSAPPFEFRDFPQGATGPGLYAVFGKRAFDLVLLILMMPVVLPVLAFVVIVTGLFGGRPLYSQMRVGQDGRSFRCWKIRTMVCDADDALADILAADPALAAEWSHKQKLTCDPRVTRVGAFLRRTSLDELPQLWNVLNGTMSLVGPRPFMPDQRAMYNAGSTDSAYYRMRPGLTGLWQISKRSEGTFAERAGYDAEYADCVSLGTDMVILFRTAAVVLRGTGV